MTQLENLLKVKKRPVSQTLQKLQAVVFVDSCVGIRIVVLTRENVPLVVFTVVILDLIQNHVVVAVVEVVVEGSICGQLCKAVNCSEYYKNNCSAGCSKCNLSTSTSSGGGKSQSCKSCAKGYERVKSGCGCKAKSESSQKTFNPNESLSCTKLCSGGLCGTYKSNKCSGSWNSVRNLVLQRHTMLNMRIQDMLTD